MLEAHAAMLSKTDVNGTLRFIVEWLTDLDARLTTEEDTTAAFDTRITALEAADATTAAELATLADSLHAVQADVHDFGGQLTNLQDRLRSLEQADLPGAVAALQQEFQSLAHELRAARHFTITIPNTERNTSMAFQIVDNDTSKVASVSYTDALGFPTTDDGATVAWVSSNPSVMNVDASTGAVAPVAPGTAQIQATVSNADGSPVTGAPADVEVIAGPAASFVIAVA